MKRRKTKIVMQGSVPVEVDAKFKPSEQRLRDEPKEEPAKEKPTGTYFHKEDPLAQ